MMEAKNKLTADFLEDKLTKTVQIDYVHLAELDDEEKKLKLSSNPESKMTENEKEKTKNQFLDKIEKINEEKKFLEKVIKAKLLIIGKPNLQDVIVNKYNTLRDNEHISLDCQEVSSLLENNQDIKLLSGLYIYPSSDVDNIFNMGALGQQIGKGGFNSIHRMQKTIYNTPEEKVFRVSQKPLPVRNKYNDTPVRNLNKEFNSFFESASSEVQILKQGQSILSGSYSEEQLIGFSCNVIDNIIKFVDAGLKHGDIKISNCLLDKNGKLSIIDLESLSSGNKSTAFTPFFTAIPVSLLYDKKRGINTGNKLLFINDAWAAIIVAKAIFSGCKDVLFNYFSPAKYLYDSFEEKYSLLSQKGKKIVSQEECDLTPSETKIFLLALKDFILNKKQHSFLPKNISNSKLDSTLINLTVERKQDIERKKHTVYELSARIKNRKKNGFSIDSDKALRWLEKKFDDAIFDLSRATFGGEWDKKIQDFFTTNNMPEYKIFAEIIRFVALYNNFDTKTVEGQLMKTKRSHSNI